MCARYWSQREDQYYEHRSRGECIRQQRQRNIPASQLFSHNSRAYDCRQKESSSQEFSHRAGTQREIHCWPILSIFCLSASRSRLAKGRERNKLIRRSSMKKALRKARSTSSVVPSTAAGSGMPQCAVMGCPGQTGQTSLAALSQIVKTKWSGGAPGRENSSQALLRRASVGICATCNCRRASERTAPEGWLPALYAVNVGLPLKFKIASAMM